MSSELALCECGCGESVSKPGNRFVGGHAWRGKKHTEATKRKISEGNKGKIFSKEHRRNLSEAHMGKKRPEEHKRKLSEANKGNRHTGEHKRKISEAMKGKQPTEKTRRKISGQNHHNWQGGKSFEPYGPKFNDALRLAIRERDNFTCQLCGVLEDGQVHVVHHCDYDKTNNEPENLTTLCVLGGCHSRTGNNRAFYTKLFQGYMTYCGGHYGRTSK